MYVSFTSKMNPYVIVLFLLEVGEVELNMDKVIYTSVLHNHQQKVQLDF
jgi:hypothetical protein